MKVLNILISVHLDKRNFHKLGFKTYLKFFDKIKIFFIDEGYSFKKDKLFDHKKIEIIKIDNLYKLSKLLNEKKNLFYLDFTLDGFKTTITKGILHFKKNKRVIFKLANYPRLLNVKKKIIPVSINKIIQILKSKFYQLLEQKFFSKNNLYICAGKKFENKYKKFNIINAHSWDFNDTLNIKKNNIKKNNYFLYLDQYAHGHPDYSYFKLNKIDPKSFYDSLNSFFYQLEKKFKKKIIIAAHPKANKNSYIYKRKSYFKGRDIYFDSTMSLTQNCFATLSHDTTAISYSVIYKKPIIFIVNNEMIRIKTNRENEIGIFAKELGSYLINIDKNNCLKNVGAHLNKINKKKYNNYFIDYIKNKKNNKNKRIDKIICELHTKNS